MIADAATFEARLGAYRRAAIAEMRLVVREDAGELYDWLRYHLGWEDAAGNRVTGAGGKLLRPCALLLGAELAGGEVEQALPAAAAVELVHGFSLLHDDIEDRSERRRGQPTLWVRVGQAQAINAGDGMFTLARLAMHRLPAAGVPPVRVLDAMRELDEACLRLVAGQHLDIAFEQRLDVTPAEYLEMAAGKTAAMFAAPFALGALLGGAPPRVVDAFRDFGHHIGLAFQAIDDVLGIWGDPEVTGKPVGDDLASRKMTYPVVSAMAVEPVGERVRAAYLDAGTSVAELAELVEEAGGRAATERLADEHEAAGLRALAAAGLGSEVLDACRAFAALAVRRKS